MDSSTINGMIREIEAKEVAGYYGGPMAEAGKAFPYIGWFWRSVNFDAPITLGYCNPHSGWDSGKRFIGFMENNKWNYEEWIATPEQSARIRELMIAACEAPGPQTLQALYDYMQTCRRAE